MFEGELVESLEGHAALSQRGDVGGVPGDVTPALAAGQGRLKCKALSQNHVY